MSNDTGLATVDGENEDGEETEAPATRTPSIDNTALRELVKDLRRRVEENYWELSVALHKVYTDSMYLDWGYQGFKEYVEEELDFRMRKAQYLISIQNWFGSMTPTIQKWIQSIGWTKAKELVGVVTPENAANWKRRLKGKSFKEMLALIEAERKAEDEGGKGSATDTDEKPARKTFTLMGTQKETVDAALKKAKEMGETDKDGNALTLICTDFLSTNQGIDSVTEYLAHIEKATGLQLVAYDPSEEVIVYGDELIDQLSGAEDEEDDGEDEGDAE